jgi:hypothetical protein
VVQVDVARLPEITQALYDPSEQVQEEATREFRKLLSIERNPPIQQVINAGVVPRFVEFLTKWQCPTLQFEAAWALTNIASGTSEHTHVCVEKGAVPMFVQLLNSPNDDVREQAVWALGNIAGDSAKLRDEVLNHKALMPLLRQLDPTFSWASQGATVPVGHTPFSWTGSGTATPKPPEAKNEEAPAETLSQLTLSVRCDYADCRKPLLKKTARCAHHHTLPLHESMHALDAKARAHFFLLAQSFPTSLLRLTRVYVTCMCNVRSLSRSLPHTAPSHHKRTLLSLIHLPLRDARPRRGRPDKSASANSGRERRWRHSIHRAVGLYSRRCAHGRK